jgi:hypothetical protein
VFVLGDTEDGNEASRLIESLLASPPDKTSFGKLAALFVKHVSTMTLKTYQEALLSHCPTLRVNHDGSVWVDYDSGLRSLYMACKTWPLTSYDKEVI